MEEINQEKKIELLIHSLVNQRDSFSNWIQKKEISIWSATLLYLGIYWIVAVFIFEKKVLINLFYKIIALVLSSIVLLLFLAFIYSQFCAWIYAIAARTAINNGIARLLADSANFNYSDFELRSEIELIIPKFLEKELDNQKGHVDGFKDKKRPIQVLKFTVLGLLTLFLGKYWRTNLRKNRERQEGIIYLLLIITWLIFNVLVFENEISCLMRLIPL